MAPRTCSCRAPSASGRFYRLTGDVQAHSLEWAPRGAAAVPLALPVLNARWQLTPAGAGWRLSAQALELGDATLRGTALLSFDEHAAHAHAARLCRRVHSRRSRTGGRHRRRSSSWR